MTPISRSAAQPIHRARFSINEISRIALLCQGSGNKGAIRAIEARITALDLANQRSQGYPFSSRSAVYLSTSPAKEL